MGMSGTTGIQKLKKWKSFIYLSFSSFSLCVSFILKHALSKWQEENMATVSSKLIALSNPKGKIPSLSQYALFISQGRL